MDSPVTVTRVSGGLPSLNGLAAAPLRRFFERAMFGLHTLVAQPGRVPIDSGLLRQSLAPGGGVTMVDPSNPPTWARVGSDVEVYPGVLDESQAFHYRDGPSAGQETAGWFTTALDVFVPEFASLVDGLGKDLEAEWSHAR